MAGICGWSAVTREATASERTLAQMTAALQSAETRSVKHTGPRAGVGHAARVPVCTQFDEILVTLHGHPRIAGSGPDDINEIAQKLAERYRQRGGAIIDELRGHFAVAIVDTRTGSGLAAADRMGAYALSWTTIDDVLYFASSGNALAAIRDRPSSIEEQAVFDLLYNHVVRAPGNIRKEISVLPAAHMLIFGPEGTRTKRYWQPDYTTPSHDSEAVLATRFHKLLRTCVADSMDDSTGSFLSGGTDSSTLAGVLSRSNGKKTQAFSIGFDVAGFDEMEYARLAAQRFGILHHEYYITPDDVVTTLPLIASATDQPFGNASAVPTLICAQFAREHGISRLIAGDGGDELFAGNKRYGKQLLFDRYFNIPETIRQKLIEPSVAQLPDALNKGVIRKLARYINQARIPMPGRMESYNQLDWLGIPNILSAEFLASVDTRHPLQQLSEIYESATADTLLDRMLALDLRITLADNDLRKVTGMCELAGIEVSYPFLHDDMVDFSLELPTNLKLRHGKLRYFFKRALADFLPIEILNKTKHGFGLPFGQWSRDHAPLRELISDTLCDLRRRDIVRADFIDRLTDQYIEEQPTFYAPLLYVLTMFELWMQTHIDR